MLSGYGKSTLCSIREICDSTVSRIRVLQDLALLEELEMKTPPRSLPVFFGAWFTGVFEKSLVSQASTDEENASIPKWIVIKTLSTPLMISTDARKLKRW